MTTKDLRSGSKRRRRVSVRSSSGVEFVGSIKKDQTLGDRSGLIRKSKVIERVTSQGIPLLVINSP